MNEEASIVSSATPPLLLCHNNKKPWVHKSAEILFASAIFFWTMATLASSQFLHWRPAFHVVVVVLLLLQGTLSAPHPRGTHRPSHLLGTPFFGWVFVGAKPPWPKRGVRFTIYIYGSPFGALHWARWTARCCIGCEPIYSAAFFVHCAVTLRFSFSWKCVRLVCAFLCHNLWHDKANFWWVFVFLAGAKGSTLWCCVRACFRASASWSAEELVSWPLWIYGGASIKKMMWIPWKGVEKCVKN